MQLNPSEWAKAQEFLLKLVQIMGPVAARDAAEQGLPLYLPCHLFIPPAGETRRYKFDARLITTLHDVKKEVEEWIEKLPEIQKEAQPEQKSFIKEEKPVPTQEKTPKKGEGGLKEKLPPSNPLPLQQNEPKPKSAAYAQEVVNQVRHAIQTLSSSSFLADPKSLPLKEEMRRLKPLIERLIEAVAHEKPLLEEDPLPATHYKTYPTEREARLKKLISFSLTKKEALLRRSFTDPYLEKTDTYRMPADSLRRQDPPPNFKNPASNFSKETPANGVKGERSVSFERNTIPAAPFVPQPTAAASQSSRKQKKKRKSFWFREEEEKQDRTSS